MSLRNCPVQRQQQQQQQILVAVKKRGRIGFPASVTLAVYVSCPRQFHVATHTPCKISRSISALDQCSPPNSSTIWYLQLVVGYSEHVDCYPLGLHRHLNPTIVTIVCLFLANLVTATEFHSFPMPSFSLLDSIRWRCNSGEILANLSSIDALSGARIATLKSKPTLTFPSRSGICCSPVSSLIPRGCTLY